jgi:hypothetical protein
MRGFVDKVVMVVMVTGAADLPPQVSPATSLAGSRLCRGR